MPVVRVRVLERQSSVNLSATVSPFMQVGESVTARELRLPAKLQVPLTLSAAGWHIGATPVGTGVLTLIPGAAGTCSINNAAYRGKYRFVPVSQTEFDVVNDVDIDSYLKGVLARELLPKWDIEAYKAQAIVARTYALYEAKTVAKGRYFDLNDDTRSQVYGGMPAENDKSRKAVDATAGIVVVYGPAGQERIFKAYFSACCGGVSQSAYDAFGEADIPPLQARNVGTLCSASPHFNDPDQTFSKTELTRRIRLWASRRDHPCQNMAALARIDVMAANPFGRPSRFILTDARNTRYSLRSEELRNALNADSTPSTTFFSSYFTPVNSDTTITFTRQHGHGHGVGLCQYCAQALALRGTRHEDIVIMAYPQAKLTRAY
jgi:stage II sporulation protein D